MKRVFILQFMWLLTPLISNGQLSKLPQLNQEVFTKRVNKLLQLQGTTGRDSLLWEAENLIATKTESNLLFASTIYICLRMPEENKKIQQEIKSNFPLGRKALLTELNSLLNGATTIQQQEIAYEKLQQKFGKILAEDLTVRGTLEEMWAKHCLGKGDYVMAEKVIAAFSESPAKDLLKFELSSALMKNQEWDAATLLLSDLYEKAIHNSDLENHKQIHIQYIKVLAELNRNEALLNVFQEYQRNYAIEEEELIKIYVGCLISSEKPLSAFIALDTFLTKNKYSESLVALAKDTFLALQNDSDAWGQYYNKLKLSKVAVQHQKWKDTMVKEKAVDFSLMDRQGKKVQLADYKGKYVVLDFWATWCGPCLRSFPGMQLAVNYYANDPDIIFLFINTWENKPDYQIEVARILENGNYNFQVLFDEMNVNESSLVGDYGITVIPTKIFIDATGMVRFKSKGSSTNPTEVLEEIQAKINMMRTENQ